MIVDLEKKELIIEVGADDDRFIALCQMYDENDTGYTRAPVEVYYERFQDMLDELDGCPDSEDMKLDIKETIAYLEEKDIKYVEVRQ